MAIKIANIKKFFNSAIKQISDMFQGKSEKKYDIAKQKAVLWFRGFTEEFAKDSTKIPLDHMIRWSGFFYMFMYESKLYNEFWANGQRKLDYYDEYPIILVLEINKKGFLGFNFHYLPYRLRLKILEKLIRVYKGKYLQDERLAPMKYKVFKTQMGGLWKYAKHGIKQYLWGYLLKYRGVKVRRIKNNNMTDVILYVSPEWIGITEREVYRKAYRK